MVSVIKRMRKLRELLNVRVGPGALVLPKDVQKISLEFHTHIEGGHWGARKFWRQMAPRIKYHNPSIPIQIIRHENPDGPSTLTIFRGAASSSSTTAPISPSPNPTSNAPAAPDTAAANSTPSTAPTAPSASNPASPAEQTWKEIKVDVKQQPESYILAELVRITGAKMLEASQEEMEEQRDIAAQKDKSRVDRERTAEFIRVQRREAELLRLARGEVA